MTPHFFASVLHPLQNRGCMVGGGTTAERGRMYHKVGGVTHRWSVLLYEKCVRIITYRNHVTAR